MKFGLFGSAQARRGGSDIDSAQGFREFIDYNVEAEALGYASSFVVEHHFTGFRPGVGEPQPADLGGGAHLDPAARHRRAGAAPGTIRCCSPNGRDHRPPVRRAARIRRRQGYRHNEFASFCIPIAEADERFEVARADRQVVDQRSAFLASRQVLAFRGHRGRAADAAEAAPADLDGGGPAGLDPQGGAARRQAAARPVRLDRADDRALQHLPGRGRGLRAAFDAQDVGVARAFYVAKDAADKRQAVEARLANQRRDDRTRGRAGRSSRACCRSTTRSMPPRRARCSGRRTRSPQLDFAARRRRRTSCASMAAARVVANLRRFAREVMPVFAGRSGPPPSRGSAAWAV